MLWIWALAQRYGRDAVMQDLTTMYQAGWKLEPEMRGAPKSGLATMSCAWSSPIRYTRGCGNRAERYLVQANFVPHADRLAISSNSGAPVDRSKAPAREAAPFASGITGTAFSRRFFDDGPRFFWLRHTPVRK